MHESPGTRTPPPGAPEAVLPLRSGTAPGAAGLFAEGAQGPVAGLLFTTNPGLEDVVVAEFRQRISAHGVGADQIRARERPFDLPGHVWVRGPEREAAQVAARQMRSVHHVLLPLHGFHLGGDPLQDIRMRLQTLPIPGLSTAASFRVTTRRVGRHPFTSLDVQAAAGAALVEHYHRPVDLEHSHVNVRVDVFERFCLVSVQLTRAPLSRRFARTFRPRAALKTPVAYALLYLAGLQEGPGRVLDPFCGSGTVLVEAAGLNPALELCGGDLFPEAIAGARANLIECGLQGRVRMVRQDARRMAFAPASVRAVVTNPPYGVRLGRKLDFPRFYYRFLIAAGEVLVPGGTLALMAWKHRDLIQALRRHGGFRQTHVRVVETGELRPRLFVLERKGPPAGSSVASPPPLVPASRPCRGSVPPRPRDAAHGERA